MAEPTDPYGKKPTLKSEPNQWHELSFQISIDREIDWDRVDLRKWAHAVARYTALRLAESTPEWDEANDQETIRTLIMGIKVDRISFVTDDELHSLIDEFEE